jgi:hypothetical protein
MQTLSVLTVEDDAIVVATPTGDRFRLPLDAALRARIASSSGPASEKRVSPREIQAHIRSGLTSEQVAAMTGVPVAFIERFTGPVLAERSYIVESALAVRLPPETEGARSRTFGAVMGERLDALAAKDVRWTSAKEPSGWVLAVAFSADDIQHAARWRFDPKHMRLDPDNVEASTLSQQGVPAALTPRLRAIEPTAPVTIVRPAGPDAALSAPAPVTGPGPRLPHGARVAAVPAEEPDRSRFDSAAFRFPPMERAPKEAEPAAETGTGTTATPERPKPRDVRRTADRPAPAQPAQPAQPRRIDRTDRTDRTESADEAERRRPAGRPERVQDTDELPPTAAIDVVGDVFAPRPATDRPAPAPRREPAPVHRLPVRDAATPVEERPTEPIRRRRDRGRPGLAPVDPTPATPEDAEEPAERPAPAVRPRRGRTSMPSWDEIVFGRDEP